MHEAAIDPSESSVEWLDDQLEPSLREIRSVMAGPAERDQVAQCIPAALAALPNVVQIQSAAPATFRILAALSSALENLTTECG